MTISNAPTTSMDYLIQTLPTAARFFLPDDTKTGLSKLTINMKNIKIPNTNSHLFSSIHVLLAYLIFTKNAMKQVILALFYI